MKKSRSITSRNEDVENNIEMNQKNRIELNVLNFKTLRVRGINLNNDEVVNKHNVK
jgi:hypothetical protein